MSIKEDAATLLLGLAELQRTDPSLRSEYIDGPRLDKLFQMEPERLSDAVALLEENGYLEVLKAFGTAPYDFSDVMLTSRGRFEAERLVEAAAMATTPLAAVGPSRATMARDPLSRGSHSRSVRLSAYRCRLGSRQPRSRG